MALEGNVRDFGLSEILQLIALQKKTGMLSITGERTMVIYFRDGLVISTRDRRSAANDPFKNFLNAYGFLSKEEMVRIEGIQAQTNLDLIDILDSEKLLPPERLRSIFAQQTQETIQEILSWPKSQYKFIIGGNVLNGVRSYASLKVEGLLMESMRRIDEFPEMLRIFPSEETILKRAPMPEKDPPELDDEEGFVYGLLASDTTLGEVISKARMSRFSTYETLKCLLEKGLLQIVEAPAPAAAEAPFEVQELEHPSPSRLATPMYVVAILASCFVIGEFAVPFVCKPGWSFTRRPHEPVTSTSSTLLAQTGPELSAHELDAALREALEEHRALAGAYPASLETLAAKGLLPRSLLDRAAEATLVYRVSENAQGYSLDRGRP
jgi:hypothetical protein